MRSAVVVAGVAQAKKEGWFIGRLLFVVFVLGVWFIGPAGREYDKRLRERPFVTALVEIIPNELGKPQVRYVARAGVHVEGRWSAWISQGGERGCGGGGQSGYIPLRYFNGGREFDEQYYMKGEIGGDPGRMVAAGLVVL